MKNPIHGRSTGLYIGIVMSHDVILRPGITLCACRLRSSFIIMELDQSFELDGYRQNMSPRCQNIIQECRVVSTNSGNSACFISKADTSGFFVQTYFQLDVFVLIHPNTMRTQPQTDILLMSSSHFWSNTICKKSKISEIPS